MNLGTVQGALAFPRWIKLSWARLLGRASLPRPKKDMAASFGTIGNNIAKALWYCIICTLGTIQHFDIAAGLLHIH